jgi:predicted HicB family RNase H-like nuclease
MENSRPTMPTPTTRRRQGSGDWRARGRKQLSLRVPPEFHARLQRNAEAVDLPDVDYVRQAVAEKMDRDEKPAEQ